MMMMMMLLLLCTGMESLSKPDSDLMPTTMGEPLRVATASPGKIVDLKTQAKAPYSQIINNHINEHKNDQVDAGQIIVTSSCDIVCSTS